MTDTKRLISMLRKTIPTLIAQDIVGVQPMGPTPKPVTWQNTLRELELKYKVRTFNGYGMGMKDVNDIMQDLYPGPYRVVEKYISGSMNFSFELEFDDPKEKTFWLLKWS